MEFSGPHRGGHYREDDYEESDGPPRCDSCGEEMLGSQTLLGGEAGVAIPWGMIVCDDCLPQFRAATTQEGGEQS